MQMRFTSGLATAGGKYTPGRMKARRGNVPGKWNAKSRTAAAPLWELRRPLPLGDESLPGRKDFQSLLMAH